MKKDLHPSDYRPVVFQDTNADFAFVTRSTAKTDETIKWEDGNEYPLVKIHISSASHPFYTGEEKIVDVEGRVDRFKARAEAAKKKRAALSSKAKKAAKNADRPEQEVQKLGEKKQSKTKKDEPKAAKAEKPAEKEAEAPKATAEEQ